ncbi:MAG: PAS domain-containing protein [Candidatus Magnetominusculus sp. LBB02]|nr:PAS domain-containing protein [Candidatus Magnetominusculus sp. LBB02]
MTPHHARAEELRPDNRQISVSAVDSFERISGISAIIIIAVGFLAALGWIANISALTVFFFSPVAMKLSAAISFILIGFSLWMLQTKRASALARFISKSLAMMAALTGLLSLFGIVQASRMANTAAVSFILAGGAVFMIDIEFRKWLRPSQFIAIAFGLISMIGFMGYIYSITLSLVPFSYEFMPLITSVLFIALAIGILFARPDRGVMFMLVRDAMGSMMARNILGAVVAIPLLADILVIIGQRVGLYESTYILINHNLLIIILAMAVVWKTATYVNKLDDMRNMSEEERNSAARFPAENPFPVIRIDRELNVMYANRSSQPLLGNLGFHDGGACMTAGEKWRGVVDNVIGSGQIETVEMSADDRIFSFTVVPIKGRNYLNIYGHEITGRKAAEKARDYERNKIQNILDSMQDGIYIVNQRFEIEYANPIVIKDFGPYENMKCYSYFHDIKDICPWCKNEEVFEGCKTVRWEFTLPKTGKTYDIIDTPLVNQDGSISKLEIFRDITDRKHMENDLRLFSMAIDNAMDDVHIVDMSGKIIYANKAALAMTGYSLDESVGMDIVKLADDETFGQNVVMAAVGKNGFWNGEILCKRKNGTVYIAWLIVNLIKDNDGKPAAIIGMMRDITAKKEIEEGYRTSEANISALMNAITESVALVDADGVFVTVNDTFARRFNKEKQEIVGKTFSYILASNVLEIRQKYLNEVISTGKPVQFQDMRGENHYYTHMYPIFNYDQNVAGVAVYAVDITTTKNYEAYLLTSIKEKEVLMREVHHRVKNNLQIVAGLVGLQLNHVEDEKYKAMFNETRDRIKSIAMVHERLYHSKGLTNVDLKQYVQNLSNDLFASFGIDTSTFSLNLNVENVSIAVDTAVPLGLIINELFTNALKYAFPDKKMGEINIAISATDGGEIEMVISDNGVGFPADLDFENAKTLGLFLVNILVKQIEGTIELDNALPGSRFTVRFKNQTTEVAK